MAKRVLAIFLLMSILVSCAKGIPEETIDTKQVPKETTPETAAASVEEILVPDVPAKDYDGKEFRIFTRGEATGKFWHKISSRKWTAICCMTPYTPAILRWKKP